MSGSYGNLVTELSTLRHDHDELKKCYAEVEEALNEKELALGVHESLVTEAKTKRRVAEGERDNALAEANSLREENARLQRLLANVTTPQSLLDEVQRLKSGIMEATVKNSHLEKQVEKLERFRASFVKKMYEKIRKLIDSAVYGIQLRHGPLDLGDINFNQFVLPPRELDVYDPDENKLKKWKELDHQFIMPYPRVSNVALPDAAAGAEDDEDEDEDEEEEESEDDVPIGQLVRLVGVRLCL